MDGGSRMASMATSLYKYSTRLTGRRRAFVAGASRGAPIPLSANTSGLSVEEVEAAEDLELLADFAGDGFVGLDQPSRALGLQSYIIRDTL